MKRILNLALIISILATGCVTKKTSHQIQFNTAEAYEKRYSYSDSIVVNGSKIEVPKNHSVWILRDDTLKILILTASGENVKELK